MVEAGITLGIMQPYIFPYIGYFQYIHATDLFILYNDVAFIKQGWVNRNNILLNGQPYLFTVPVNSISSYRRICDTKLDEKSIDKWRKNFLSTLFHAYHKAPQYELVIPLIQNILFTPCETIDQLAAKSVTEICTFLEIKTIVFTNPDQYRNDHLHSQERIIDICLQSNAKKYINPIGGQTLYFAKDFLPDGIELKFIKSKLPVYQQLKYPWVPSLSIIDVLMFNSKTEVQEMLNEYVLI